jgi:diaminohydroxyphosphoribosylaminopyrimidine deaminase/5-amino-6-(5-phosphoribosylamino)uracil reductase
VKRVVIGISHPKTSLSGKGITRIREAGILVMVGTDESGCKNLNETFIHRMIYNRPFGILKYAMTLDGKIATTSGHSAWVSSTNSRNKVHHLRAACDAIIVGGNTVRKDNPHLTCHQVEKCNPLRVVMSSTLDLPTDAHVWKTSEVPTLVFTEVGANPDFKKMLIQKGVEIVEFSPLTTFQVMHFLYERGFSSVLWECGGTLAARAISEGSIQKVLAFIAPKIIGGRTAPSPIGDLNLVTMTQALDLEQVKLSKVGPDYLLEGYLPPG